MILSKAITESSIFYQPQIRLDNGRVYGAEALIRPGGGYAAMSASEYVTLLENDGRIREMDEFVFQHVCADLREIRCIFPNMRFSVNVSRRTLEDETFADKCRKGAFDRGLQPCFIEFEVTESYLSAEIPLVKNTIEKLRSFGFTVAIDDFGKGYSCLSFINEIEFDVMKTDNLFLNEFDNAKTKTLLIWTLELAKLLRKISVAEGVETAEQALFLRNNGCDIGQGYFFGKPMPYEKLKEYLLGACPDKKTVV